MINRWRVAQEKEKEYWTEYELGKTRDDRHARNYGAAVNLLSEIQECSQEDVILDVGCGPGNMLELVGVGIRIGLDPLLPHFRKLGLCGRTFEKVRAVGENIPFRPGTFNKVFCYNVLDHVADPEKILVQIRGVMKKRGYLLLALDIRSPIVKLRRRVIERFAIKRDLAHPHSFTMKDTRKFFRLLHFRVVRTRVLFSKESSYRVIGLVDRFLAGRYCSFVCFIAQKE